MRILTEQERWLIISALRGDATASREAANRGGDVRIVGALKASAQREIDLANTLEQADEITVTP